MIKNIVLILSILTSVIASAERSSSVEYLMNDQLTMFEWGLYKIEIELNDFKFDGFENANGNSTTILYDWDTNRIIIFMAIYPTHKYLANNDVKDICRKNLYILKQHFGYGVDPWIKSAFGSLSTYFEHKDFVKVARPKDLTEDIENITKITLSINSSDNDSYPYTQKAECTSMLLEKDIYFVDLIKK